jgi:glycosyltransferase involved in cell wall biosynthesis
MIQRYFIRKKFNDLQNLCVVQFDTVWSFDNSVFFDFSALPKDVLKINHIVDMNQNFQVGTAARTAHICFASGQNIVKKLSNYQHFVYFINHGVPSTIDQSSSSVRERKGITALYAGNLGIPYIDWDLLLDLVRSFPKVDFVFLGPKPEKKKQINRLREHPNVTFAGPVPSEELKKHYACADMLLICYKADKFMEQVSNSHKLMEYLASGKVVVATFTQEYVKQAGQDLIAMSSAQSEFIILFQKVLGNLPYWNSEFLQSKRKEFAMENTYPKQINLIERLINQRLEV